MDKQTATTYALDMQRLREINDICKPLNDECQLILSRLWTIAKEGGPTVLETLFDDLAPLSYAGTAQVTRAFVKSALDASPAQAPGLSNTEGTADQSDSTKEDV